jgi:prepilin-type N-terminal cleavage/methylation domain-containing protein
MKCVPTRTAGFTLVEIMIVVAIIGLLGAIAIPNFLKSRSESQRKTCIANLKQIEGAIATWALEAKKVSTDSVDPGQLFGSDKYIKVTPTCYIGGSYNFTTVGADHPVTCPLTSEGHTLP